MVGISSVTGAGLDELMRAVFAALPETETPPGTVTESARDFEVEHRVYRPGEEEGFDVVAEGEGRWRVSGRGIEMLIARHDLENPEALDYLEGRLREIGVISELQRAGFEPGDEVVAGRSSSTSILDRRRHQAQGPCPDHRSLVPTLTEA